MHGRKKVGAELRRRAAILALFAAAALLAPSGANATTVVNGDFETGNLSGWQLQNSNASGDSWFAYSGTTSPLTLQTIAAPPQGSFAAVTDQGGPGTHILYQDVALEPGNAHKLSLFVYYRSSATPVTPSPDSLNSATPNNQQYRVEVLKPSAAVDTVNPADILATVFRTKTGVPSTMAPTLMTADLTPFAGQTVRLRLSEVDNQSIFQASADAVSISNISNVFSFNKLKRNKHKGTATLSVNVPGPGTLSLTGKGVKTQRLGGATASKVVAAAGAVKLLVKAKGKAKHKLNKTGKARVKASVTFAPTGGVPATQTKSVKLIKKH